MSAADTAQPVPEPPVEGFRVLVPSAIGPLALELAGGAVARLLIAPKPAQIEGFAGLGRSAAAEPVEDVVGRLAEFFAGARKRLDVDVEPALADLDPFASRVLREVARIPYGKTRTYREVAGVVGRQEDAERVRAFLLANPVPIFVPCHRVVLGHGKIGAWVGGSERKRWLLNLEKDGEDAI